MATKEEIKSNFQAGDVPTEEDFAQLIDSSVITLDSNENLPIPSADNLGQEYSINGNIWKCVLNDSVYSWQNQTAANNPNTNYLNMSNKPRIEGHVLSGNVSLNDINALNKAFQSYDEKQELNGEEYILISDTEDEGKVKRHLVQDLMQQGSTGGVIERTPVLDYDRLDFDVTGLNPTYQYYDLSGYQQSVVTLGFTQAVANVAHTLLIKTPPSSANPVQVAVDESIVPIKKNIPMTLPINSYLQMSVVSRNINGTAFLFIIYDFTID